MQEKLDNWFTYHSPDDHTEGPAAVTQRYGRLRAAGKAFAEVIVAETPPSADQSDAIRKVREAVMTANAAIACEGR